MIVEDEAHRTYEKRCAEIQKLCKSQLSLAKRERDEKLKGFESGRAFGDTGHPEDEIRRIKEYKARKEKNDLPWRGISKMIIFLNVCYAIKWV